MTTEFPHLAYFFFFVELFEQTLDRFGHQRREILLPATQSAATTSKQTENKAVSAGTQNGKPIRAQP